MTAQRGAWVPLSAKDSPTDADPDSQWCPSDSVPSQLSEACHHSVFWEKKPRPEGVRLTSGVETQRGVRTRGERP